MKSKTLAYLLWFFLGGLSAHRFYLGKYPSAILYLLTGQLFGIGWIVDVFLIGGMVDRHNLMQEQTGSYHSYQNGNVTINVHDTARSTRRDTEY